MPSTRSGKSNITDIQSTSDIQMDAEMHLENAVRQINNDNVMETLPDRNSEVSQKRRSMNGRKSQPTERNSPSGDYSAEKRHLPGNNVPEKIIFCLDSCEDENSSQFELPNGENMKPLAAFKHAIKAFMENKNFINLHHQYALVVLNENAAKWVCDFTYFPDDISKKLDTVETCESEDSFNLNAIFDEISTHITIPMLKDNADSPPYVVRLILLYNRSYAVPKLDDSVHVNYLLQSPFFMFDTLMTHESFDEANNAKNIYNALQEIDRRSYSFMFAVERNFSKLFNCMAKLLGHPLQRASRNMIPEA